MAKAVDRGRVLFRRIQYHVFGVANRLGIGKAPGLDLVDCQAADDHAAGLAEQRQRLVEVGWINIGRALDDADGAGSELDEGDSVHE